MFEKKSLSLLWAEFKADWRSQTWTIFQWFALVTILFSPVWTENLSKNSHFGEIRREVASNPEATTGDVTISSEIVKIPASFDTKSERVFVSASQIRFEWRRHMSREPAARLNAALMDLIPHRLELLSREGIQAPQEIPLINSDVGDVVISNYIELEEGVNQFDVTYRGPEDSKQRSVSLKRKLLVVLKKNN